MLPSSGNFSNQNVSNFVFWYSDKVFCSHSKKALKKEAKILSKALVPIITNRWRMHSICVIRDSVRLQQMAPLLSIANHQQMAALQNT
jgi:hypothetical protein